MFYFWNLKNSSVTTKKEEEIIKFESTNSAVNSSLKCLRCNKCDYLSFALLSIQSHKCIPPPTNKISCPGCSNEFNENNSFKSHLLFDHLVCSDEIELFIKHQKLNPTEENQPKSKIFIKDVTLLRKPDLPHNDTASNIFDLTDLTVTDDDPIFDDFLGSDDQIFDDEFDFEPDANLSNVESFPIPSEPAPDIEIITPPVVLEGGKIFVRKNLADEAPKRQVCITNK